MKYSRAYLEEVQDDLMKMTDTKLLVNAVRVIKKRMKQLDESKEWVRTFIEQMSCDNFPNALKSLKRIQRELEEAKENLAIIQEVTGSRTPGEAIRIIQIRFVKEFPDWLEVPSPSWKGKDKNLAAKRVKECKNAYKKMLVWLEDNPDDEEKIIEEARLSYLCGSPQTFIASCERLYLLAKMEEFKEIEAKYKRLKKMGGNPDKSFNYRATRLANVKSDDGLENGDSTDGGSEE